MFKLNDDQLENYILRILKKKGSIVGEGNLMKELRKLRVRVSPKRIRRVVFKSKNIEVEIKFGKGKLINNEICPICSSPLVEIKNADLDGNLRTIGYKCDNCNYNSISKGKPYLYIFRLKYHDL